VIVPSIVPEAPGVNVTLMVQLAPIATVPMQSLVASKLALTTILVICSPPVPVFVKVTV
jgi:hypothetical protein